ncbi:MAG: hypothetical protein AAGM38_11695 [Pseudomonadota bacterium]
MTDGGSTGPETTQRAEAAVGPHQPAADWRLEPETHAKALADPVVAAPLVEILNRKPLAELREIFNRCDAAANDRRDAYKRAAQALAWTGFAIVVLAGAQLLLPMRQLAGDLGDALGVAQLALIVVALTLSWWLQWRRPFQRWRTERAEAESARLKLFEAVLSQPSREALPSEAPALALKLEYVRRFLLEDQKAYFAGRGAEQKDASFWLAAGRWIGFLLIAGSIIGALLLGPLAPMLMELTPLEAVIGGARDLFAEPGSLQRMTLFLSTIGAGLQGLVLAYVFISFDERNAAVFRDMAQALSEFAGAPLKQARASAACGDDAAVQAYFAEIRELLLSEHLGWRLAREFAERHAAAT